MQDTKINLTLFCSSKANLNSNYYIQAENFIKSLNPNNLNIVYGGGGSGMMGNVRKAWLETNGKIISANVTRFIENNIIDDYIYDNIVDRQKKLVELGDGYLVLPGGYGTHYETLEVICKNDIGETSKPIFIFNINGVFTHLINQINFLINEGFITNDLNKLNVFIESDPNKLIEKINNFFNF